MIQSTRKSHEAGGFAQHAAALRVKVWMGLMPPRYERPVTKNKVRRKRLASIAQASNLA
jgi:hypothetical protein